MNRAFQEARDFAGADWRTHTNEGRARLLEREGISPRLAELSWAQLPETAKAALAKSLLAGKR